MNGALSRAWNHVFFRPAHPLCLVAARTILCLQAVWILLSRPDLPDLARWPDELWILADRFLPVRFGLRVLPPAVENGLFVVLHAALLAALFGLRTRAACLTSAALLYHFAPFEEAIAGLPHTAFGGLTVPALGLFVLAFAEDPAGCASLHPRRAGLSPSSSSCSRSPTSSPPWPSCASPPVVVHRREHPVLRDGKRDGDGSAPRTVGGRASRGLRRDRGLHLPA